METHHQEVNTEAGLSRMSSISSAELARLPGHPAKQASELYACVLYGQ